MTRSEQARASSARQENSGTPPRPAPMSIIIFMRLLIVHVAKVVWATALRGIDVVETWLLETKKARYGLAVTRILLGTAALGLLLSNFSTRLYSFGSGSVWNGEAAEPKSDFPKIWVFSIFHRVITDDVLFTVLYLALTALAVAVILGWRFRIVGPVFFVMWVSFIESNDMLGDQGDNMFRIAFLIMLFADPAGRWSLDARRRGALRHDGDPTSFTQLKNLLHNLALVALTAQVSFVYMSGALYKAGGTPWSEGYAIYNPLSTERFGTWPILSDLVTTWGPLAVIAGWGSIILQMAFPFLLLSRPTRVFALIGILGFHIGIAVLMGLPWFSLTMVAIDSIFIRDRTWSATQRRIVTTWRTAAGRTTSQSGSPREDRIEQHLGDLALRTRR